MIRKSFIFNILLISSGLSAMESTETEALLEPNLISDHNNNAIVQMGFLETAVASQENEKKAEEDALLKDFANSYATLLHIKREVHPNCNDIAFKAKSAIECFINYNLLVKVKPYFKCKEHVLKFCLSYDDFVALNKYLAECPNDIEKMLLIKFLLFVDRFDETQQENLLVAHKFAQKSDSSSFQQLLKGKEKTIEKAIFIKKHSEEISKIKQQFFETLKKLKESYGSSMTEDRIKVLIENFTAYNSGIDINAAFDPWLVHYKNYLYKAVLKEEDFHSLNKYIIKFASSDGLQKKDIIVIIKFLFFMNKLDGRIIKDCYSWDESTSSYPKNIVKIFDTLQKLSKEEILQIETGPEKPSEAVFWALMVPAGILFTMGIMTSK